MNLVLRNRKIYDGAMPEKSRRFLTVRAGQMVHQVIAINCIRATIASFENVDFEWHRKAKDFNDRCSLIIVCAILQSKDH